MNLQAVSWILWGVAALIMMVLFSVSGVLFGSMPWFHRFVHVIILFFSSVGLGDLMAATYAVIMYAKANNKAVKKKK